MREQGSGVGGLRGTRGGVRSGGASVRVDFPGWDALWGGGYCDRASSLFDDKGMGCRFGCWGRWLATRQANPAIERVGAVLSWLRSNRPAKIQLQQCLRFEAVFAGQEIGVKKGPKGYVRH